MLNIIFYDGLNDKKIVSFYKRVFKQNGRQFDENGKDKDLLDIKNHYLNEGGFWCLVDNKNRIWGAIGLRRLNDCSEIRRFFIDIKKQGCGHGTHLLSLTIKYAIKHNIYALKAATMNDCISSQKLFQKFGFLPTDSYNNSTADRFFRLDLTLSYKYTFLVRDLESQFNQSLILNPTENIPCLYPKETEFFEGLYVSERFKDLNDKVIFSGRNTYIEFFEFIKKEWCHILKAFDVDLKTLSGLHAHMIFFMCVLKPTDKVMLLPEICGGHYSTQKILESIGANVVLMEPDYKHLCVDKTKTIEAIKKHNPKYIFIDRSEGLVYEDFSWLAPFKNFKIFDASQYLSQILTGEYQHPFDMGFDMLITTLHKNYPGPQKGLLVVKEKSEVWDVYQCEAKTYISNTHPLNIANSLLPLLDFNNFERYSNYNALCSRQLEKLLLDNGVPVVTYDAHSPKTMHTWVLCETKAASYSYYIKLENLKILANYRLLPYGLGYGLRIGTSAAVQSGLRPKHIPQLASIMSQAYYEDLTPRLIRQSKKLIAEIKKTTIAR